MASKNKIPGDILRQMELEIRERTKSHVVRDWAKKLGVSEQTLHRYFTDRTKPHPELVATDDVKKISAIKMMTLDKKDGCLSTGDAIDELKRLGELPQDFKYTRGTIDRLMRKYECDIDSITQESPAVHMVTYWPNQVHEVDATVAPTYYLNNFGRVAWDPFTEARHARPRRRDLKLILYSGWDHFSSCLYARYFIAAAENSVDLFHFLYEFWSRKQDSALPFHGFPSQYLYTDQGGIWKSRSIISLMSRLGKIVGFQHKRHMPGAPRATGGAESSFNTLGRFEKKLRVRIKKGEHPTLDKLNEWLYEFLVDVNNAPHRGRQHKARAKWWLENIDGAKIKTPPPFIDFIKMAYTRGETRQLNKFTELSWRGKTYHLPGLEDLNGREIFVWHGFKEDAIYIEHLENIYGPYYPGRNEVPFGQYKSFPLTRYEKTRRELKEIAGELVGKTEDYGYEDPTYIRQDNIQHKVPATSPVDSDGGVADAQYPVQKEFKPDEAMLYIAMTVGFYWDQVPIELKDFVAVRLEDRYLKKGAIERGYLDGICAKIEPVLENHGLMDVDKEES